MVQKIGEKIFLDKRDNTEFDLLTVSETAAEPPQDEGTSLNSPRNLALEATFINHNYSQQVLKREFKKHVIYILSISVKKRAEHLQTFCTFLSCWEG